MDRRRFLSVAGSTAGTVTLAGCGEVGPSFSDEPADSTKHQRKPIRMHVGTQRFPLDAPTLQFFKRHGVDHISSWPDNAKESTLAEDFQRAKELCEKHSISLDIVAPPLLGAPPAANILLGKDPERDREIAYVQKPIAACAKADIPAFKYNMRLLFGVRSGLTPGRGGSSYSTWRWADAKQDQPLTSAGRVTADVFWERITYYLERIIPVCDEYKIRAACHPHDPGVPPEGYKGVVRVLGTVEGLKRFVAVQESPYHGLNFCVGTVSEMLQDPAREIFDVIRYFGERKKLFNIHFRNIRGKRDDFYEVYPDNGEMNMVQVARTLYEVDYPFMVMPDHMPRHPDDPDRRQAFAFGYGYIKGVFQSLETLV